MDNKNENLTENGRPSFLDQILTEWASATAEASSANWGQVPPVTDTSSGPDPIPPKKRQKMTPGQIAKIIGALFLVALVFFASFLAYVVFNPTEAKFFLTFGINLADVASLLQRLVNGIFGAITFVLWIVSAIMFFRAIITKKEFKKKKTVSLILAIFLGTLMFSNIGFWAYLFNKIGASDFVRPNGGVTIYDNELYLSSRFKDSAEIYETDLSNVIGPITVRFDLASDSRYAAKTMNIESYEVDYGDGAEVKKGTDPETEKDLIHTYSSKGKFTPKGYYYGTDKVSREPMKMAIGFVPINIVGIVDIRNSDNTMTFDAKDIASFGNLEWYLEEDLSTPASTDKKFTTSIEKADKIVCLTVQNERKKKKWCDRVFFVDPKSDALITAKIVTKPDPVEPLKQSVSLSDVQIKSGGELVGVKWSINDDSAVIRDREFTYSQFRYGENTIKVELTDSANNTVNLETKLVIGESLKLLKNSNGESKLKVKDESGNSILDGTYQKDLGKYQLENFKIPATLTFDASDIRVEKNEWFESPEVSWKFSKEEEKKGAIVEYQLVEEKTYEITVEYSFKKRGTDTVYKTSEVIEIDTRKADIAPSMTMQVDGGDIDQLYAPARITFDASASSVRNGKIAKFIYDFGEGKNPSEWDAVQTYQYNVAGDYTVKLTVMKDDGTKAEVSRKIIVKDVPKKISISSSVSSGKVGYGVDFTCNVSGQIAQYAWEFGDNTPPSTEANPTHVYEQPGDFPVKLTATYADGTIRTAELEIKVEE